MDAAAPESDVRVGGPGEDEVTGCLDKARMVCEVVCFVVSLPAVDSRIMKAPMWSSDSRWPSTSACTMAVIRSSLGWRRRSLAISIAVPRSSSIWLTRKVTVSTPASSSSSPTPANIASAALATASRSSGAMPIMSDTVRMGRIAEHAFTKSTLPAPTRLSTISRAFASICEDLVVLADVGDVLVPGGRPEAGLGVRVVRVHRLVPGKARRPAVAAQAGEGPLALGEGLAPERPAGDVQVVVGAQGPGVAAVQGHGTLLRASDEPGVADLIPTILVANSAADRPGRQCGGCALAVSMRW